MRRKYVDETRVLELSKLNWSQKAIADDQHCSRQNISIIQKKLREAGKLEGKAQRGRVKRVPQNPLVIELSLDRGIDLMLKTLEDAEAAIERAKTEIMTEALKKLSLPALTKALEKAKLYPETYAEMVKYRRGYNNLIETRQVEEQRQQRAKEQQMTTKVAIQQGDIKPNFTEHI